MNVELRQADERFEVITAAEGWHAARAIDDATLANLHTRFRDDRRRTKPAFRALFFLFTLLTGLATWGFLGAFLDVRLFGGSGARQHIVLLSLLAAGATFAAHHALGTLKLRRFGIDEGLVALAIGFELSALGLILSELHVPDRALGFVLGWNLAAIALVAAGRWGITGTGALAGCGLFGALALLPMPYSRLAWIAAAIPLVLVARWISDQDRAAVAHRRRARELSVVSLVALYLAVHVSAASTGLFSALGGLHGSPTGAHLPELVGLAGALGWAAMIAIPLLLLGAGLRRRDRLDLALGALGLAATAASVADALDLGPLWLLLTLAGALLIGAALLLRAVFRRNPEQFVAGFTDEPLFDLAEGRNFLEIAASLALFTPAPRPVPTDEPPTFRGEGGEFGGGGASSQF